MSWIMNDLICHDCGHREYEAMYKRAHGPDNCPECEIEMAVDLNGLRFTIRGDGPGSFTPVDFGVLGKAETRDDYNRCVKTIEERFPGHSVVIEGDSQSQKKQRVDELKHKTWANRKAKGLDPAMVKKMDAERKIKRKQQKTNAKPSP